MHKRTFIVGLVFTLLSLFLFTSKALAGGQLVSLYADTHGSVDNGSYGRVMRVFLHPEWQCKGTEITFRFITPQDGDYITTAAGSATYTMLEDRQPYNSNDYSGTTCGTYAKMYSKVYGEREVTVDVKNGDTIWKDSPVVKVDFDGQYHGDNHYNGHAYRTSTIDPYLAYTGNTTAATPTPYPAPTGTLTVAVLSQQIMQSNNRSILLKWSALNGESIFYDIYGKSAKDTDWQRLLSDQGGPSATVTIKANEDYSIKVQGCVRKVGNCVDSNVLLLAKIHQQEGKVVIPQVTSIVANGDNQKVEELNQKVSELEGKLAESQKRQNALELAFNNLISWLKTHIPFFR